MFICRLRLASLLILAFGLMLFSKITYAQSDVMMQGFYWNVPSGWYQTVQSKVSDLQTAGFTAIWLPPPSKGASGSVSMGYDVFDQYDIGNYYQEGTTATLFGTEQDLLNVVSAYHTAGIQVYADIVMNQMDGGAQEWNPYTNSYTYTKFVYPHHTFEKYYEDFHPNDIHPDNNPPYHNAQFGPDLCQAVPDVSNGFKIWGDWLTTTVGYDGYRLDDCVGIEPGFIASWLSYGSMSGKWAVGEFWDGNRNNVENWINQENREASAFDFPLFFMLNTMCNSNNGSFDMTQLDHAGLAGIDPYKAVTFAENHDTDRSDPIITNKMMAYAYILFSEGRPCVFWKDYYNYGLKPGIDNLIWIREHLDGGATSVLYKASNLYIAQRNGNGNPGCVLALNDNTSSWLGAWVQVQWPNTDMHDYTGQAADKWSDGNGWVQLWAPPNGYAIYAPAGIAKSVSKDSVNIQNKILPQNFDLLQNYPNPFNPSTQIVYELPKDSYVTLKVYNSLGQEIKVLVNGMESAGEHSVTFNDSNLPSGLYIYQIQAGKFQKTRKMVLLK